MRQAVRFALALTALGLAVGIAGAQEAPAQGIFAGHGVAAAVAPGTGVLSVCSETC